jgi:quinolinate synthase
MESLVQGQVVNQIIVPEEVRNYSKLALERMLAL